MKKKIKRRGTDTKQRKKQISFVGKMLLFCSNDGFVPIWIPAVFPVIFLNCVLLVEVAIVSEIGNQWNAGFRMLNIILSIIFLFVVSFFAAADVYNEKYCCRHCIGDYATGRAFDIPLDVYYPGGVDRLMHKYKPVKHDIKNGTDDD